MAYTQFYRDVVQSPEKITWKEIFSEYKNKHGKSDMEYAMLAGSSLDTASESDMLQKWKKPWLFWRVFLIGCVLSGLSLAAWIVGRNMGSMNVTTRQMAQILCPMLIPCTMMVFFWELNIPRNMSIWSLCAFFLAGGIVSLFIAGTLFLFFPPSLPSWLGAPLREEPAKLAATIICLLWFSRGGKHRVYGLTGLVIGAAVGTAFDAFESVSYSLDSSMFQLFVRMASAIAGHTVFCAPYSAALALHMRDNHLTKDSFLNRDFLAAFAVSTVVHGIWDADIIGKLLLVVIVESGITCTLMAYDIMSTTLTTLIWGVILWMLTLKMTQKCLQQAVLASRPGGTVPPTQPVQETKPVQQARPFLRGTSGCFNRQVTALLPGGISLGRDPSCSLVYPPNAPGISRRHCMINYNTNTRTFLLRDLDSTNGTYINGSRIPKGGYASLHEGDTFSVGGMENSFQVYLN